MFSVNTQRTRKIVPGKPGSRSTRYFGDRLLAGSLFVITASVRLAAQTPAVEWEMSYGSDRREHEAAVATDGEGGYFLAGTAIASEAAMAGELWGQVFLVRTDPEGKPRWQASLGGKARNEARCVEARGDGGCVVAGKTASSNEDDGDALLLGVDAGGNLLWQRTFGGDKADAALSVTRTSDGGFVLAGSTESFTEAFYDAYLVKVNAEGQLVWQRSFGGGERDYATYAAETADGGYILTGQQRSFNPAGSYDVYLVRTDVSGNLLWQSSFGGEESDQGAFVEETGDGGFIVVAYTKSFGAEPRFVYVIRTDPGGRLVWQRTFGPNGAYNAGLFVHEAAGGGFLVGATTSGAGDYGANFPYLIRTDATGEVLWERILSGEQLAGNYAGARSTGDGGFIFAGETSAAGASSSDLYALKLVPLGVLGDSQFIRGDCNSDDDVTGSVTDAVFLLQFNFTGGPEPPCLAACDANGDGAVIGQVTDAVYLLQFNFTGGSAPPSPFPGCGAGASPQDSALGCRQSSGVCQ